MVLTWSFTQLENTICVVTQLSSKKSDSPKLSDLYFAISLLQSFTSLLLLKRKKFKFNVRVDRFTTNKIIIY